MYPSSHLLKIGIVVLPHLCSIFCQKFISALYLETKLVLCCQLLEISSRLQRKRHATKTFWTRHILILSLEELTYHGDKSAFIYCNSGGICLYPIAWSMASQSFSIGLSRKKCPMGNVGGKGRVTVQSHQIPRAEHSDFV